MINVAEAKVGDSARVKLLREGKPVDLSVKVMERPGEVTAASPRRQRETPPGGVDTPFNLGLGVADLTPTIARELRLGPDAPKKGVVVVSVRPGGLAEQAGMEIGDVILDINKKPVKSAREAASAIKQGPNSFRILRGGSTILVFMDAK
jgi:serine protease Do